MNKDVIYIDVEDDITAIIGKVKDAKQKIVALVPPKRIGVLQSAVNLRLLARTAATSDKHLVLISNNASLLALAAAAKIPVARNLQSKPELAAIPALDIDDGDDVIDGAQLPVGELARTADQATASAASHSAVDTVIGENAIDGTIPRAVPPTPGQTPPKPRVKSGSKVPNFNTFRKKLALIIAAVVLLLGLLIWAIFFAPRATVLITARTTDASVNTPVTLSNGATTSSESGIIRSTSQQIKKDVSLDFTATGSKDVGDKATGQVVFRNCETPSPQAIAAGTTIIASGQSYVTQEAVTVPGGSGGFSGCSTPGESAAVTVVASDIGEEYNLPSGATFTVAGHANTSQSLYFRAVASGAIAGGTKRQVKVVTADDVQKATQQLAQQGSDDVKSDLKAQFGEGVTAVEQTFRADTSAVKAAPAVDSEAPDAKAKLVGSVTYTMTGIEQSEIERYLDGYFEKQIANNNQKIYDNGSKKVALTNVTEKDGTYTANIIANAKVGPKIDDEAIKELAKGKRYGEIQSSIEAISGVQDVDVKFSPFWVSSAPNDVKKIKVEFKLNESN